MVAFTSLLCNSNGQVVYLGWNEMWTIEQPSAPVGDVLFVNADIERACPPSLIAAISVFYIDRTKNISQD